MKRIIQLTTWLLCIALLPLASSCNDEDDVIEIFTGKTWKMSRLTDNEKNAPQFYKGIWNSEKEQLRSMEYLNRDGNFTVTFEGTEINGEIDGTQVVIQGIQSKMTGTWTANGQDNTLKLQLKKTEGSETDPLAKAFMAAMKNVYKYEGDVHQLTLYYKHDQNIVRKIGFFKQ